MKFNMGPNGGRQRTVQFILDVNRRGVKKRKKKTRMRPRWRKPSQASYPCVRMDVATTQRPLTCSGMERMTHAV